MPGKNYSHIMNEPILHFIEKQTCATVCCVDSNNHPWCFSCFYAVDAKNGLLLFKSSPGAFHVDILRSNPKVAGTILPDKLNKLLLKGLQFNGMVLADDHPHSEVASRIYLKRHPVAMAISGEIYCIRLDQVKFTDNALGFGKKIIWNREAE